MKTAKKPWISVIVPTLNEADCIGACLDSVKNALPEAELIVVDAGSHDHTVSLAKAYGASVYAADEPSRGGQCRLGAKKAGGDILFFLHADCPVGQETGEVLRDFFSTGANELCKLTLRYRDSRPIYALLTRLSAVDHYYAHTGDQGIVVRRELYERVGGMPCFPLFEDVEFLRRARRLATLTRVEARIFPSVRRFQSRGALRQLAQDFYLMTRYAFGSCPYELAASRER